MRTAPPDMLMSELTSAPGQPEGPSTGSSPSSASAVSAGRTPAGRGQAAVLQRAGFSKTSNTTSNNSLARSSSMPSVSPSRLPMRDPVRTTPRANVPVFASTSTRTNTMNSSTSSITTKSKGLQMVGEMRARVRTLEQKLQSRVPRLRMGSVTGRNHDSGSETTASNKENASTAEKEKERSRLKGAESPGWVLIMEDSTPQPKRISRRTDDSRRSADSGGSRSSLEQNRALSPTDALAAPTSFRPGHSTSAPSTSSATSSSGLRRPGSRLSASTDGRSSIGSTISTLSSATTTSRPSTPTFLPVPSSSYRQTTTTTPGASSGSSSGFNGRRSSLGLSAAVPPTPRSRDRPTSVPMGGRPFTSGLDKSQIGAPRAMHSSKELPSLPSAPSPNPLAQSRIGRPVPSAFSRRPVGLSQDDSHAQQPNGNANLKASTRLRAGSFKQ